MSRISSQGSLIMISSSTAPVPLDITAATKAKPCVITVAAGPAPVVGDIIVPRNTGWNSLEGMPFKVMSVVSGAVTLEDSDTTREVANINTTVVPVGTIEVTQFIEMCRSNFSANNPAGATIDVTTLCDIAHRIVAGLPAIGTWTAAGFYDAQDVALERARDAYRSGEDVVIDVRLPNGAGFAFMGIVNTYDVSLGVNTAVTNTLGGQIDGRVNFYKTPAPGFVPIAMAA
jgi:hypothetical protein